MDISEDEFDYDEQQAAYDYEYYDNSNVTDVEEVSEAEEVAEPDETGESSSGMDSSDLQDTVSLLINGKLFVLVEDGQKGKCTNPKCAGERSSITTSNRGSAMTRLW